MLGDSGGHFHNVFATLNFVHNWYSAPQIGIFRDPLELGKVEAVTRTDRFSWTVLEIKQIASEINMTLIKGRVARIYFPYNFITCFQETFTQSGFLLSDRNRLTAGTNAIKFGRQVSSQNITCKQLTFHVIFILICHDFDWSQLTVCVIIYISQSVCVSWGLHLQCDIISLPVGQDRLTEFGESFREFLSGRTANSSPRTVAPLKKRFTNGKQFALFKLASSGSARSIGEPLRYCIDASGSWVVHERVKHYIFHDRASAFKTWDFLRFLLLLNSLPLPY